MRTGGGEAATAMTGGGTVGGGDATPAGQRTASHAELLTHAAYNGWSGQHCRKVHAPAGGGTPALTGVAAGGSITGGGDASVGGPLIAVMVNVLLAGAGAGATEARAGAGAGARARPGAGAGARRADVVSRASTTARIRLSSVGGRGGGGRGGGDAGGGGERRAPASKF